MQEFKCEICGGESYWGRRAFERHFKEWKHQNGMRALGIPNNKNFFEVTQIKDALELWTSIQVKFASCGLNQGEVSRTPNQWSFGKFKGHIQDCS